MRCQVCSGQVEESREYPCGVCRQGVGIIPLGVHATSLKLCIKWIHKRYCGIAGRLQDVLCGRLRWYGHVERKNKTDWVLACREL